MERQIFWILQEIPEYINPELILQKLMTSELIITLLYFSFISCSSSSIIFISDKSSFEDYGEVYYIYIYIYLYFF